MKNLSIIVAFANDQAIGFNGTMPWHLSEDLKHFKEVTFGQPVIMGRRTWESLPRRPLPGRLNIVVSATMHDVKGCLVVTSPAEAISLCPEESQPFVIGGGTLYRHFLPLVNKLYITRIYEDVEADTWFPEVDFAQWNLTSHRKFLNPEGLDYAFQVFERKTNEL